MESEWEPTTLGEFVRFQRGHDLTANQRADGPYPVMGSAGQNGTHNEYRAQGPGVVVGRSGASIGRVHFTPSDYWPHNTCLYVTDFLGNDHRFAFYLLASLDLAIFNSGSAQPSLNRNYIYNLPIVVPKLSEQQRISDFLAALDDRIDNLRQTNTTLEAIAQALFKSWFVDFDPVRAKAEGREPEGMDAATAALFPSEFEDSELGPIPKGWRAGTVGDLSHLNASKWTAKRHPDTIKYIDLSAVNRNHIEAAAELEFDRAPSRARQRLQEGDTIVGTVRPGNRAYAYIHEPEANLTGSTGFAVLSPKEPRLSSFVYLATTSDEAIARLASLADGAAYPAVRPGVVGAAPCVLPSDEPLELFSGISAPMLERIVKNRKAAGTIADLRGALLPRLISGRLRLPEVNLALEGLLARS